MDHENEIPTPTKFLKHGLERDDDGITGAILPRAGFASS
jgi:hypothetical protein